MFLHLLTQSNPHHKFPLHAIALGLAGLTTLMPFSARADDTQMVPGSSFAVSGGGHNHHAIRADDHAPIGVMGDHMHKKGEWMLSYRYMRMNMEGNQIGENEVTPEDIVTTVR